MAGFFKMMTDSWNYILVYLVENSSSISVRFNIERKKKQGKTIKKNKYSKQTKRNKKKKGRIHLRGSN